MGSEWIKKKKMSGTTREKNPNEKNEETDKLLLQFFFFFLTFFWVSFSFIYFVQFFRTFPFSCLFLFLFFCIYNQGNSLVSPPKNQELCGEIFSSSPEQLE